MVSSLVLGFLLSAAFLAPASSAPVMTTRADVTAAVRQMQDSGYYTFVTLINLMQDRVVANITLLMPDDKNLSGIQLTEWDVPNFLANHSIPSNLPSDHLARLPTGTLLPTGQPHLGLLVASNGSRIFLNGIEIVMPDICSGGTISCHGISGVMMSGDAAPTCVTAPPGTFAEWPSPDSGANSSAAPAPAGSGSQSSGEGGVTSRAGMIAVTIMVSLSTLLYLTRLH